MHIQPTALSAPFSGNGGFVHAVQHLSEWEKMGLCQVLRAELVTSDNLPVRSAAAAAVPAEKSTHKPPDTRSPYNAAVAHHLAQLLAVSTNKDFFDAKARAHEAWCLKHKSPNNLTKFVALDLPDISPESEKLWFETIQEKIETCYGGFPVYPGSHLPGGLHDFNTAMITQWREGLLEILRGSRWRGKGTLHDDEWAEINQHLAAKLHTKWVENLKKAFGRVLRTWPHYWELVPHEKQLECFISRDDAINANPAAA